MEPCQVYACVCVCVLCLRGCVGSKLPPPGCVLLYFRWVQPLSQGNLYRKLTCPCSDCMHDLGLGSCNDVLRAGEVFKCTYYVLPSPPFVYSGHLITPQQDMRGASPMFQTSWQRGEKALSKLPTPTEYQVSVPVEEGGGLGLYIIAGQVAQQSSQCTIRPLSKCVYICVGFVQTILR